LSVFDPTDLCLPPALPPESAGLWTVAEKRLSSSDTSNSGALWLKDATPSNKENDSKMYIVTHL
jgi:hypothetical protein